MRATVSIAAVSQPGCPDPALQPITAMCFGISAERG